MAVQRTFCVRLGALTPKSRENLEIAKFIGLTARAECEAAPQGPWAFRLIRNATLLGRAPHEFQLPHQQWRAAP